MKLYVFNLMTIIESYVVVLDQTETNQTQVCHMFYVQHLTDCLNDFLLSFGFYCFAICKFLRAKARATNQIHQSVGCRFLLVKCFIVTFFHFCFGITLIFFYFCCSILFLFSRFSFIYFF